MRTTTQAFCAEQFGSDKSREVADGDVSATFAAERSARRSATMPRNPRGSENYEPCFSRVFSAFFAAIFSLRKARATSPRGVGSG